MEELKINFENWLMEYHCEHNSEILDDQLPDAFNEWITDLDPDTWIELGQKYAVKITKEEQNEC